MILAVNNIVFPNSDSKITINTYKIRLGQKLRMLPWILQLLAAFIAVQLFNRLPHSIFLCCVAPHR